MIHFVPDFLLPARFEGRQRRYLNECISLAVLFILCFAVNFFRNSPESGLLPGFANELRSYLHLDQICPLCGATRSFLFMCGGDIVTAAHYSFFGVFFFFGALIHLALKTAHLLKKCDKFVVKALHIIDRNSITLWGVFILWIIQLILHFTGIFSWYPLIGHKLFNFQFQVMSQML